MSVGNEGNVGGDRTSVVLHGDVLRNLDALYLSDCNAPVRFELVEYRKKFTVSSLLT